MMRNTTSKQKYGLEAFSLTKTISHLKIVIVSNCKYSIDKKYFGKNKIIKSGDSKCYTFA